MFTDETRSGFAKEILDGMLREDKASRGPSVSFGGECETHFTNPLMISATGEEEELGCAVLIHQPEKAIESIVRYFVDNYDALHSVHLIDEDGKEEKWNMGREPGVDQENIVRSLTYGAARWFVYRFSDKIDEMLREHLKESILFSEVTYQFGSRLMALRGMEGLEDAEVDSTVTREVVKLIKETSEVRKKRLLNVLSRCTLQERIKAIRHVYEVLLPTWQAAKSIYKDNRARPWQKFVKSAYSALPDDLIERLSDNPADWSQYTQSQLTEKGGDSSPSDVALEHAARMCGAKRYQYTIRHLYELKSNAAVDPAPGLSSLIESFGEIFNQGESH